MKIKQCKISPPIKGYSKHSHPCWEIVCQLEGEVTTYADDKVFILKKGDVFLTPPDVLHSGTSDTEFIDLSLCADGIEFSELKVFSDTHGEIAALITIIQRLITEKQGDYVSLAESLTDQVARLIRYELGVTSDSPFIEKMKRDIYDNLSNPDFSIADNIVSIGFNKDYFRRCFKASTGKTPTEYLTELRITRAKQLLTDKKMFSISAIAESCGFSDSLYFSTCFKKHVGISPSKYRSNKGRQ